MISKAIIRLFLATVATMGIAGSAMAQKPVWTVVPPANGSASMTRTLENVTLAYKRTPDDDDRLHITVGDCGDSPWEMDESLNGVTAKGLRDTVAEAIYNAKLNCKLAEGVEDRLMAGFDEAFAKVKPFLPPHRATVGGWQLTDKGSMPGDDRERTVTVTKKLATVSMTYRPGENGEEARTQIEFTPCNGSSNGSGFDFGNPPEDHLKVITEQVTEAYSDFAKECKTAPESQAVLMQDFPEALKAVEQWMHEKPFINPPDNSSKK
ncbi:MAG TPA: hypothetical protein VLM18_02755 [Croceibacterium sp.]|nr:hypothetical protein [Croceibacterium sp.]